MSDMHGQGWFLQVPPKYDKMSVYHMLPDLGCAEMEDRMAMNAECWAARGGEDEYIYGYD